MVNSIHDVLVKQLICANETINAVFQPLLNLICSVVSCIDRYMMHEVRIGNSASITQVSCMHCSIQIMFIILSVSVCVSVFIIISSYLAKDTL